MEELKKHLTLTEQVDRLRSRGLIIADETSAEQLLLDTNYYRLTGYLHDFKIPGEDRYIDGLKIERVKAIYDFDRRLARIIMYALEDVEETLKSRFSYIITDSHRDDPLIYLKPNIYQNHWEYYRFLHLFDKEVSNNSELPFVKHHNNKYGGQLPMWVAVELLTMGNLSSLYKNLASKYKKAIAKTYDTGYDQLGNWIENLTYTRNHLAHYMRVYNYNFGRTPKECKNHPGSQYSSNKIFDQICVASYMYSNPREWNSYVIQSLWDTLDAYKEHISLDAIGFPSDWETLLSRPVQAPVVLV